MVTSKLDLSRFKSNLFKFNEVGDEIIGRLVDEAIEKNNLDSSKDVLKLVINEDKSGIDQTVYCPTMLAQAVADADPDIGDRVRATMTGERNIGRPSKLKEFDFEILEDE